MLFIGNEQNNDLYIVLYIVYIAGSPLIIYNFALHKRQVMQSA